MSPTYSSLTQLPHGRPRKPEEIDRLSKLSRQPSSRYVCSSAADAQLCTYRPVPVFFIYLFTLPAYGVDDTHLLDSTSCLLHDDALEDFSDWMWYGKLGER